MRKTDEQKIKENKEAFEKAGINDELIFGQLKELIKDKDEKISKEAIRIYEALLGKREKCWVENCNWRYGLDIHHIDHNHENNNTENLIKLCPNHHYLHHRNKIRLEDLFKFSC